MRRIDNIESITLEKDNEHFVLNIVHDEHLFTSVRLSEDARRKILEELAAGFVNIIR